MATDQIEYCGGCAHYEHCDKKSCIYNKAEPTLRRNHEDDVQFGCVCADVADPFDCND